MKISIVVPCYNEQEVLEKFYEEINRVTEKLGEYEFDFIFVDDGSKDATLLILKDLAKRDDRVKYISFSRNFGKESALFAGLSNSNGDLVAVMDADLQDPPSLLPEMLEILEIKDCDCVATKRGSRDGDPKVLAFFARMFYKIINKISDTEIADGVRDFRIMKREMLEAILTMNEYDRFSKGIFGWTGFKTEWLSYESRERAAGSSKWNFKKLFKYGVDAIINFSQVPLSLSAASGGVFTFLSAVMLIKAFIRWCVGAAIDRFSILIAVIFFVGGVQLLCLGIIGKYVAKTFAESKKRPHYIARETNIEENFKKIG